MALRIDKTGGSASGGGKNSPLDGIPKDSVDLIKNKLAGKGVSESQVRDRVISFIYDATYETSEITNDLLKQILGLSNTSAKKLENRALMSAVKETIQELRSKTVLASQLFAAPPSVEVVRTSGQVLENGMSADAYRKVLEASRNGIPSLVMTKEGLLVSFPGSHSQIDLEDDIKSKLDAAFKQTDDLMNALEPAHKEHLEVVIDIVFYFMNTLHQVHEKISSGEEVTIEDLVSKLKEIQVNGMPEDLELDKFFKVGQKLKVEDFRLLITRANTKFFLPNRIYYTVENSNIITEPILYKPTEFTSPDGHTIPVYCSHPYSRNKGNYATTTKFMGDYIVYPTIVDELFSLDKNINIFAPEIIGLKTLKGAGIVRGEITDFFSYVRSVETEAYLRSEDPREFKFYDSISEELEHLDCKKLAEKRLGKKVELGIANREVEEITAVLKPGPLLDKLDSIDDPLEKNSFAKALHEVRAKVGMLRTGEGRVNFTPYSFIDSVVYALVKDLEGGSQEDPYYMVARDINKRLLGEKLLGVSGADLDNPNIWFKYLNQNINFRIGADSPENRTDEFILKLDRAAREVLEENFYLN